MNKKNILVVGSLNMDMTVSLKNIPKKGETVLGEHLRYVPGGKGANQVVACAKLGDAVTMLGSVGSDSHGSILVQNLRKAGVIVDHIQAPKNETSGLAIIYVEDSGKNNIVVIPGANEKTDIAYLEQHAEVFAMCDYLLVQMEIPLESVLYVVKKAKQFGAKVILNPAPSPDPSEIISYILQYVDIITPNETELQTLTGWAGEFSLDQLKASANSLLEQGPSQVIVTLGGQGAALCESGKDPLVLPPPDADVVDTVAAGDCFNGALIVALSEGKSVEEAIRFANCASTIAVTRKGAQDSIPSRDEVEKFIKELTDE